MSENLIPKFLNSQFSDLLTLATSWASIETWHRNRFYEDCTQHLFYSNKDT